MFLIRLSVMDSYFHKYYAWVPSFFFGGVIRGASYMWRQVVHGKKHIFDALEYFESIEH